MVHCAWTNDYNSERYKEKGVLTVETKVDSQSKVFMRHKRTK